MRNKLILGLTFAVLLGQVVALRGDEPLPVAAKKPWLPELAIEKYQLQNGLTVILHEDHKTPLVAVNVTYNVGSKDDPPGRTGFAHLFEHMMFKGSENSDWSYFGPIYPYFAKAQGSTGWDRTVYDTTVTSNALELVLWLEADRMGFLLPAITEEKLANTRNVVKMERRETLDDLPLGEVEEALIRVLYPPGHPYHHMIAGSMADLSAARLPEISTFFQRHYAPNNAFLCLAGDFRPAQAKRWIRKYFGSLGRSTPVEQPKTNGPALVKPCHMTLTDRIGHDHVEVVWNTVPAHHPDEAPLDVLASVLGGASKWNRLYRVVVDDRQIATQVSASHPTRLLAGRFEVILVARDGQKLDELVRLADAEIERLKRDGPTAEEVHRVKIERRTSQIEALESVTSKASTFNYNSAALGNPLGYRETLAKIFAVTPADVVRVARQYLGPARIQLDVLRGERSQRRYEHDIHLTEPDQRVAGRRLARSDKFDRSVAPFTPPTPRFVPPLVKTRRLSNGLELRIVERHELPHAVFRLVVKAGETSTPPGKEGLGSIAFDLFKEGTKSRSTLQLEADLLELGATLAADGFLESSTVTLTAPVRHMERALDLYADVILNPSFPVKELHRLKLARLALLEERSHNAVQIAEDVFPRLLYRPGHPYARAERGTLQSVESITRQDVIAFYRQNFVPANAVLVIVGDVHPDTITAALESRFGKWPPGPIPERPDLRPKPAQADHQAIYLIDKPGAEQSVLSIGRIGTAVTGPDRHTWDVLLNELGGRIHSNLRDDKGFSYGFSASLFVRNGAAPFAVTGSVHMLETKEAILEVFKEMIALAGSKPVTESEIAKTYDGMVAPWFERFETMAGVASEVGNQVARELPDDHFATDLGRYAAVTEAETEQIAERYLNPNQMTCLVVGDRGWIEPQLRSLSFVKKIRLLDSRGNPLPDSPAPNLAESPKPTEDSRLTDPRSRRTPPAAAGVHER
jgi:zinc protease